MAEEETRVVRKKGYVFTSIFIREDLYKAFKKRAEFEGMHLYELVNRCLETCRG